METETIQINRNSEPVEEYMSDYIPSTRRAWFYRAWRVLQANGRGENCEGCGLVTRKLHVHHIDRDITNTKNSNLIPLCYDCHREEHPERLPNLYEVKREYRHG